jgi:hypothetical protein
MVIYLSENGSMNGTDTTNMTQSAQDLMAEVKARGFSLPNFARQRGYVYNTVIWTLARWGHRVDRTPHGGLARQIMADLRAELFPNPPEKIRHD